MNENPLIHEALALAKSGDKAGARAMMNDLLRDEPDNASAWLILAQVAEDRQHAIRCMRQVIRLRPDDAKAQAILSRLVGSSVKKAKSAPLPPIKIPSQLPGWLLPVAGGGLVLILCLAAVLLILPRLSANPTQNADDEQPQSGEPAAQPGTPTPTTPPRATEVTIRSTVDPEAIAMAETLRQILISPFDPIEFQLRTGILESRPESVQHSSKSVGSQETFFVIIGGGLYELPFTLRYRNDAVDMWVQSGFSVDTDDLKSAADTFARDVYPAVRDVFGSEWSPGIDNDPRLAILHVLTLGANIAGQFVPIDEYPVEVYEFSNEREMFYMSLLAADVGSDEYMSTLAHEFQHMIRFHGDGNEQTWMDEGMAQLAQRIAGYDTAFTHYNYLFDSRVPLNSWSPDFRASYSNYGAGYLFNLYVWEQFGTEVVREIASSTVDGLDSVDAVLATQGTSVDAVFANWIVANYVNDPSIAEGQYGYTTESLIPVCPRRRLAEAQVQRPENTIPQYSAHYIELEGQGEFIVDFRGDTEVPIISSNAYSGRSFWWSNRENRSGTTLTRAFDLTQPARATLQFWTWHDIQQDADMGYVQISQDNGKTWRFVNGTHMVAGDPESLFDYGPHYTGSSGGGTHPLWMAETIDLTAYVGQEVLIRFEYISDGKSDGLGWAIDNIRIPEIEYLYDVEQPEEGWEADGWVRTSNVVPQNWAINLVTYDGATTVTPLTILSDGSASVSVNLGPEARKATLIVGAMAPVTGVDATYRLTISGTGVMDPLRNPPGVLLQDDFENPCSTFTSFVLPDYRYGYEDGRYEIAIDVEDTIIWGYAQQDFINAVIDVDTVQEDPAPDSSTGIICRYEDEYNYYLFEIRNDGTFQIYGVDDYEELVLQDWTASSAINTGQGAVNHLRASCVDDTLSFTVNGVTLATVTDSNIHRGDIGFSAGTFDTGGIRVAFDNLIVLAP